MKKLIALLLIATLALGLLTGCAGSDGNDGDAGSAAPQNDESPYEIVMAYFCMTNYADVQAVSDAMSEITLEKINATVKLLPMDVVSYLQQMPLMLSGDEKLDTLLISQNFSMSSQIAQGQLVDITDLVEKLCPDAIEAIGAENLDACKVNGVLYGLPPTKEYGVQYGAVMRKDLVEKYDINIDAITTWEDLGPVFEIIKANEPEIYPLVSFDSSTSISEMILGSEFDLCQDKMGVVYLDDQEGTVVNLFETSEYRSAIDLVRSWYNSGYVYKDITTTQETGESLMAAGKAFCWLANMKPGYAEQESKNTGVEMVQVNISDGISCTQDVAALQMGIARNCENVEKTLEFLNLLYTDADLMNLLANGIEGQHYVLNEQGKATLPEGVTDSGYVFNHWEIGNNFITYLWDSDVDDLWGMTEEFNSNTYKSPAFGLSFDLSEVSTEVAAVSSTMSQYRMVLENGTVDAESMLPQFVDKLQSAGINEIISVKQAQMDEFLSK